MHPPFSFKAFSVVVAFSCMSFGSVAGTNGWTNVSPPGGIVRSIIFDSKDPNLVFADGPGVIYRSTDAGRSWEELSSPTTPRSQWRLVVSPTQSGVVYSVNGKRGISVSTDRGDCWSFFAFPDEEVSSLTMDPTNGSHLYAIAGFPPVLHKSTDGGVSWVHRGRETGYAHSVAVSPFDGSIFLSTSNGIHRSLTGGTSWIKTSDLPLLSGFIFHPKKPEVVFGFRGNAVFKSTDKGHTWVFKTEVQLSSPFLPSFIISPEAPYEIYTGAGDYQGVSKSTDEGETWNQWNTGLPNLHVNGIAFRRGDPNVLLVATDGAGVFRREEQGDTWISSANGIRRPEVTGIAFDQPGNGIYISTAGAGVFRSPFNDSFEWTPLNEGLYDLFVRDITIDPHNSSILYAVCTFAQNTIYRTTDAGLHWEPSKEGLGTTGIGFLASDPQVPGRVLLTGGAPPNVNWLFESTNHGASWTRFPDPIPGWALSPPVIDSQSGRTYLVAFDGLYRTQTPAGGWEKLTSEELWRLAIEPGAPDNLLATTRDDDGIARSTDGGRNWKKVTPPGTSFIEMAWLPGNPQRLLALGPSGLFVSVNSGETWTRVTGSPSAGFLSGFELFGPVPSDPHRLLAGFRGAAGLFALDKTDSLFFPLLAGDGRATGLALTNHRDEALHLSLSASGISSRTASLSLAPGGQKAGLTKELLGFEPTGGWVRADQTRDVATGLASVFSPDLSALDALPAQLGSFSKLVFPEADASARLRLGNSNAGTAEVLLYLVAEGGTAKGEPVRKTIAPSGLLTAKMADLFPQIQGSDYIYVSSTLPLFGAEEIGGGGYLAALSAQDPTGASQRADLPHFAAGPGVISTVTLVNADTLPGTVSLRFVGNCNTDHSWSIPLPAAGKATVQVSDLPGLNPGELVSGSLEIESADVRFIGSVRFTDPAALRFGTTLPVHQIPSRAWVFPHLVSTSDFFTSVAVLNPGAETAQVTLQVIRPDGSVLADEQRVLPGGERLSKLLTELFPSLAGQELNSGSVRILSDRELTCIALFGSYGLNSLSAIPANVIP